MVFVNQEEAVVFGFGARLQHAVEFSGIVFHAFLKEAGLLGNVLELLIVGGGELRVDALGGLS